LESTGRKPRYRAYLLRCWEAGRAREPGGGVWRFSLEDPQSGKLRYFADLESLIAALRAELTGARDGLASASERPTGKEIPCDE
jgi:hypothetical protein